jgi:hypothetical protein
MGISPVERASSLAGYKAFAGCAWRGSKALFFIEARSLGEPQIAEALAEKVANGLVPGRAGQD